MPDAAYIVDIVRTAGGSRKGALASIHPLGATGTKLIATLVHGLRARDLRWGLPTMCEGGGVANATIVEAL